jgi:hypothetical protein
MTQLTKEELHEKFETWINKFKLAKQEIMSLDLSKIFMSLLMMELHKKEMDNIPKELLFAYEVTRTRAESISLKINHSVIFLISIIAKGVPGTIVMFLYYLRHFQFNNDDVPITIELIANRIFPFGFPSKESLFELWDEQKVDGKNLLDFPDEILFLKKENND